jgi:hypothetical protein
MNSGIDNFELWSYLEADNFQSHLFNKLMIFRSFILSIASLWLSAISVKAQSDTIPFILSDHNNMIIASVINGVDSVDLMFHTDASGIALIKSSTDSLNSIVWGEAGTAISWGGEHDSRRSANNSLSIGKMHWDSLGVFEDERSGPYTDGKIGPDLFEGKCIEVNFDQDFIVISNGLKGDMSAYEKRPLITENGSMFIEGISNIGEAYPNRFLIHTGFGGTVLFDDEFVKQTALGTAIQITEEQDLKDSFGNVIKTRKGTLPLFTIGELAFKDLTVGFFDGSIGQQKLSIIGGGLIKQMNFVIDANREFIYIAPSKYKG